MKKIKFNLNKEDWLYLDSYIELKKVNIDKISSENYKTKWTKANHEIDLFNYFIKSLNDINHNDNILFEFNYHYDKVLNHISNNIKTLKRILISLFENNEMPFYWNIIVTMNDNSKYSRLFNDSPNFEYKNILRNTIEMANPIKFQEIMCYLDDDYQKAVTEKDMENVENRFHKHLRQIDFFDNSNLDMILWNLLNVTRLPHVIFKTILDTEKSYYNA